MNKDKVTVINLGWSACYIVNVKDVTPLLEILNRSQPVDRRWADGAYWVLKEKGEGKISIEQDGCPVVTGDNFKIIAEAVEAAKKEEEAKAREEAEF